jgi:hypothetical protein
LSIPGAKRSVKPESGYGTADLSVNLSNGMITSFGQKTDTKIPETLTSLASAATGVKTLASLATKAPSGDQTTQQPSCKPQTSIFHIVGGQVSPTDTLKVSGELQ